MGDQNQKARGWCFTINNWTGLHIDFLDELECKHLVFGKETGESGTPHLQGTVYFSTSYTMKSVLNKFKPIKPHLEICKDYEASITYCKKEGNWVERGDPPMSKKRQGECGAAYWADQLLLIKAGRIEEVDPKLQLTHCRNIEFILNKELLKKDYDDTTESMLWYWGKSGTGKSRKARTDHPTAYLKMCNKWWDGYAGEDVVIVEDFDKNHECLGHHVKIWGDRYPFPSEKKGSAFKIRPKLIIVTSNWHPSQIWNQEETLGPILRRYKCVEFKEMEAVDLTK